MPTSCAQLLAVAEAAESALATAGEPVPDIKDLVAALAMLEKQAAALSAALDVALASTERLLLGVEAVGLAVGTGTPDPAGSGDRHVGAERGPWASSRLNSCAASRSSPQALDGRSLPDPPDCRRGIDGAASGADDLADGSELLADGAKDAASGADALAEGSAAARPGRAGSSSGCRPAVQRGVTGLATGTDGAAVAGGYLAEGAQALQDGTGPAAEGGP